ncbi:MAG: hypothetical protein ACK5MT_20875 [Actinomycetales bacterium]
MTHPLDECSTAAFRAAVEPTTSGHALGVAVVCEAIPTPRSASDRLGGHSALRCDVRRLSFPAASMTRTRGATFEAVSTVEPPVYDRLSS